MTKREIARKKAEIGAGLKSLGFKEDTRSSHFGYIYKNGGHWMLIAYFDPNTLDRTLIRLLNDDDTYDTGESDVLEYYTDIEIGDISKLVPIAKKAIKMLEKTNKSYRDMMTTLDKFVEVNKALKNG